jgi:TRAP-type C4-dicarboxylate transport system permease small subunit
MGRGPLGQGRRGLTGVLRLFDRALEGVACALLVALLTTVLLGVVTRAADAPLSWTDEGARFLMVWLACFGWMIAGRRRAHVRIRFFQGLLPAVAFRATEWVIQAAMVLLGGTVAWFAISLVERNADLDATSLPISMAWLYVPLVPAGLMMALQAVSQMVERPR